MKRKRNSSHPCKMFKCGKGTTQQINRENISKSAWMLNAPKGAQPVQK